MNDQPEPLQSPAEATESEARRRFLKNSGGMALAAPAVVLLLSAHSKSALAVTGHYTNSAPTTPPKKNILDP